MNKFFVLIAQHLMDQGTQIGMQIENRLTHKLCSLYQLCICRKAFVMRLNTRCRPSRRADRRGNRPAVPPQRVSPDPCHLDSIDCRRRPVCGCRLVRARGSSRLPAPPAQVIIMIIIPPRSRVCFIQPEVS